MKQIFLVPLLLAAAGSLAAQPASPVVQPAPPTQAEDDEGIIVTGRRLTDTERALAECLARKCPPDEDIDATLAHAENLFVAGKYQDARRTTKASLVRNRDEAKKYPVPVSDLERANGRLSAHLGEGYDYQYSTFGIRRALKAGLPKTDPRLVGSNIEIADMLVSMRRTELARQTYADAEKDALKIGRRDLAATARMRSAWIDYLEDDPNGAKRKLRQIAASTDPMERVPRLASMVLLARLDRKEGKFEASDALVKELGTIKMKQPALLYSPDVELPRNNGVTSSIAVQTSTDTFDDKWIDVAFWVKPDGRVADVEVIRDSGATAWAAPLLKSIKGRIYTPSDANGAEGAFRVERYSYTALWGNRTGTRIRQRGSDARVEFLDLTVNPDAATKKK